VAIGIGFVASLLVVGAQVFVATRSIAAAEAGFRPKFPAPAPQPEAATD
jgi:hypothetical protein